MSVVVRGRRWIVVATAGALVVTGCSKEKPVAVVTLIDFSGSISPTTVTFYSNTIRSKVLEQLAPNDRITLLPVDSRAESKEEPVFALDLSKLNFSNPHDGLAHKAEKEHARLVDTISAQSKRLDAAMSAVAASRSGFRQGTDVIGALQSASHHFHLGDSVRNVLLVFSDMIQESAEVNLRVLATTGEAGVPLLINRLVQSKRVPTLTGVAVVVIGAGETEAGGGRGKSFPNEEAYFRAVRLFWKQFFQLAGASLDDRHYGYRTQDLIADALRQQ